MFSYSVVVISRVSIHLKLFSIADYMSQGCVYLYHHHYNLIIIINVNIYINIIIII